MKYEPKQKNKIPEVTVAALFVCAGVAFAFSSIELIPGKGMLQLLAVALIVAMVFIFIRYKMTSFCYSVRVSAPGSKKSLHHEDDEETVKEGAVSYEDALSLPITAVPPSMLELVCERRQGKSAWITECLLKLTDIEGCYFLPEEEKEFSKALSSNKRIGKYKYFKNMFPAEQMVIISDSPAGRIAVYLEYDRKICDYIKAVAGYNKGN